MLSLFAIVAIITLAACGTEESQDNNGGESGSDETSKLTAWAWDPKFNIAALEIAEENYDGEEEFELEIIENAQPDIIQKLNTGLSSGTTKGLPNIVLIEDYRAQSFLQAYPDAFYPLDDYFNTEDFAEYKIAPTGFDGNQYGLPFDTGSAGLYVRTDLLEEAGYTAEDFNNLDWNEFIELGKDVTEKTGKHMLTLDPNDLGTIRMMIQTAGSWYVQEDGVTPNIAGNEALKEAFKAYKQMLDLDLAKITSDWSQFVGAFNGGEVVTIPTGNWITPSVKAEESQSGQWEVVTIPRLPIDGAVNASNLGGSSFYVLNIDGKEKAADFLANTFGSNTDFYESLVTDLGALGTYLPAQETEAYQSGDEFFGGQEIFNDFATWMDEIPGVNYGMHTYAIEDILVAEMQNYLNGKDIDEVLEDAQAQAEAQLK